MKIKEPCKILYKKSRKTNVIIIASIVIICMLIIVLINIIGLKNILGVSDNCTISEDYLRIDYYDEVYKHLDTKGYDAVLGDTLVEEAATQDPIILKLLFGDSVISVNRAPNNELIYLQTDYDELDSKYYCLENKHKEYQKIIEEFSPQDYYIVNISPQITPDEIKVDKEFREMILSLNKESNVSPDYNREKGDNCLLLISFEKNGIFYKEEGEIIYKNKKYYYFPYKEELNITYEIEESYYPMLNEVFDRIGDIELY